jgi:hypothetical protein
MDEPSFSRTVEMSSEGGAAGVALFALDGMDDARWTALKRITGA